MARPKGYKQTEEQKRKISEAHKRRFILNPSLRMDRSITTKRLIKEGKIKGFQKGNLNVAKSMEVRKKLSEATKRQMAIKHPKGMLGKKHSPEVREKIRKARARQVITEEHKRKLSEKMRGRKLSAQHILNLKKKSFSEEHRRNISNSLKGKKYPIELYPNFGCRKIRSKLVLPKRDTSIELKIQRLLSLLHLEFVTHKYISEITHGYQCDIFIPVQSGIPQKTIIECDGCFFHCCPICKLKEYSWNKKRKEMDKTRTKELQDSGFRVIRLWEHEIKKMKLNNLKGLVQ